MPSMSRDRDAGAARKLAAGWAAGRVGYALGVMVSPRRFAGPWLGDGLESGGGRVAAKALVARDALAAIGLAAAVLRGAPVRPWIAVCVLSDAADIAITLSERADLPERSPAATAAVAGVTGLAGAALFAAVDE